MRHIYIRGSLGLIWLVAAIVCGVSGNFPMMGLYLVLAGVFLYSAYAAWKSWQIQNGGVTILMISGYPYGCRSH